MRANRKYPPVTLGDMFADRPDVLKVVTSAAVRRRTKRYKEVDGPVHREGALPVLKNIEEGAGLLEREQWVVPLTQRGEGRPRAR